MEKFLPLVHTYTCIGKKRALQTDTDINNTVQIFTNTDYGIGIGATLMSSCQQMPAHSGCRCTSCCCRLGQPIQAVLSVCEHQYLLHSKIIDV